MVKKKLLYSCFVFVWLCGTGLADTVNIGLNYPKTGPYSLQGLAQIKAAQMAVEEINETGGIKDSKIKLVIRDTKSKADLSVKNVEDLIDNEKCAMIFGGSSSAVAIAGGKAAKSRNTIYFGTLTASNTTTCEEGHKYMFREYYNAWMGARVLSKYLREKYLAGKKYFYITADYSWGHTTEASIRKFSNTSSKRRHKGSLTPFPGATEDDFRSALKKAEKAKPDVLVLVLYGNDMATALKLADSMGIKQKMKGVVVPILALGSVQSVGAKAMEGVIGTVAWCWEVPYIYNYETGKKFVEKFADKYGSYPSQGAATAYTILYQYKDAVERAGTFDTKKVIASLEGHKFSLLKDEQMWRKFDHQNVQTVYAVKCKPKTEVMKDKFRQDYFEIVEKMSGDEAARDKYNWTRARSVAGKSDELEW
ncbi:MAG: ABC transporter substrate-binding protein [Desulfobacterales bacterium]|nr:ABC transporter substrate-binding protein [Desulfobacterales bacterium]